GFSELSLKEDRIIDFITRFYNLLVEVNNKYKKNLQFILASDTIFIATDDDSEESFRDITYACSYLLFKYIRWEFPIKGCISYGDYIIYNGLFHNEVVPTTIYGPPIIDAHNYENDLNWIGIMISPLAIERNFGIFNIEFGLEKNIRIKRCHKIPFKDGTFLDGLALLPLGGHSEAGAVILLTIDESIKNLTGLKLISKKQKDQQKYENSILWLQDVKNQIVSQLPPQTPPRRKK
ncbi:MAG: hypothetical protein O8C56_04190, partial [Candidatus Methanoperedens sp.]|nr:hypothetical protein [Candidatus Methanoperedens sp.]